MLEITTVLSVGVGRLWKRSSWFSTGAGPQNPKRLIKQVVSGRYVSEDAVQKLLENLREEYGYQVQPWAECMDAQFWIIWTPRQLHQDEVRALQGIKSLRRRRSNESDSDSSSRRSSRASSIFNAPPMRVVCSA